MPSIPLDRRAFVGQTATATLGLSSLGVGAEDAPRRNAKRVKVGVIGCGSVSTQYLPHLSRCPFVELVSTCDIIPERARDQANRFKVPNHYPHIDRMLAGAAFDLLVNLT